MAGKVVDCVAISVYPSIVHLTDEELARDFEFGRQYTNDARLQVEHSNMLSRG